MKRKILSIFLALVLVCSFSLVTAVPAASAQEELNVYGYGSQLHVDDGTTEWAEISIPVDIILEDISTLKFWEMIDLGSGKYDVNVVLCIDLDGDGDFEANLPEWHGIGGTMHTTAALAGDSFIEMDGALGPLSDDVSWSEIDALSNPRWWTPNAGGDGLSMDLYCSFSDMLSNITTGTFDTNILNTGVTVLCVKLLIGGSGSWMDETAYVDEVTINDETYYLTIQRAVDSATSTIINVAPGTYNEDVIIDKSLTLEGAQAGVDARGRTGDESEIVGVVAVTSDATNVVFDGFKFTSPTREFAPRGFNLHIESESSTVSNNIFVAEENAGHTYSGYLDFGGITNATVTQNSFSGHLDLTQNPNVVMLGIAGAGTVTVADNEMHDVGGGGGIGIMCGNAEAVVNIDGNVIENTGNECIWVANWLPPGYSTFATLSITSNDLSEATKNGIKFELPVVGTVLISGNKFWDNPVQVLDLSEVLDIQDVLDNNDFDRAVVVRSSAIKVPKIFSSIQDAVGAAEAGDTVDVIAGQYNENVFIDPDKDGLQLIGAGSGETFITSDKPVVLRGWNLADAPPLDGFTIKGFTLVTTGDLHAFLAGSGTNDGSTYTTNLELADIVVDGGQRGIGLNAVQGVTFTDVHISNISGSGEGALELTGVSNLLFTEGSIEDNAIGVRLQPTGPDEIGAGYGPNGNIQIHFTNFCGNGIAIENQDSGTEIDATNNWWGNPNGPGAAAFDTYPAGDAVSGNVNYSPWITGEIDLGAVDSADVTNTDPDPVTLEDDEGNPIATVDISGGNAAQGTITAARIEDPAPDGTSLSVGTGTTGVVFLDVKVTGYTEGWAHITVPYTEPLPAGVEEDTLGLYYWDEADTWGMWRLAANSEVNTEDNFVSGDIPVSALTGTPIGLGGYEALVAIDSILNLSISGEDTVELTINTNTAFLGAATIDLMFDPMVVEVLGVVAESSDFDTLEVNLNYAVMGSDMQTARFLAYQRVEAGGVDATDGAVVAVVELKAVGSTMDFSHLALHLETLKDNKFDRIPRTVGAPSFALVGGVGDANRDTYVDLADVVDIERVILGITGYRKDRDTMNVDGKDDVDAADCAYLAQHLIEVTDRPLPPDGWIPPWAWPRPAPGPSGGGGGS